MLKKWFISTFPGIEKISHNLGPNLVQKLWKIESEMKRCIASAKPRRTVFRFFARYYDAEEVVHQHISRNWENITKSGAKFSPKIMKSCLFNEKVHRIRKTSQNRFSLFRKILQCLKKWFISSFPEIEKISQNLGPKLGQKWWQIEYLMKRCIGSEKNLTEPFFAFSHDITMPKKWFISTFPGIGKISQNLGPNLVQKLWKVVYLMKSCIVSAKTSQNHFSLFRKILRCWRSDS